MSITHRWPRFAIPTVLCCALAGGVIVRAHAQEEQAPGSLAGVIAEIRQLRVAVEESNRRQSHIQMLSVYLSAQQSRLVETANRLEATRRELEEAVARTQEGQRVVKMFTGDPAEAGQPPFPPEAAGLADMFKPQIDAAREQEARLRAREAEMWQALQLEEARWDDLIARLEQSVQQ